MTVENEVKVETTLPQELEKKTPEIEKKEAVPAGQEEAPEDPNWRAFREGRKKDRQEKEAAERRAAEKEAEAAALKAAMEAAFAKEGSRQSQPQYGYEPEETEDERIEKKVQAALAAREASYERERAQREQQEYPERLRQSYPDFNQIVSSDNLDYLEYHYPEVAAPLRIMPEGFDKWSYIYKAVKKFVPNNTTAKKEAVRAENNFNKPKSMSSTGVTQPGEAKSSAILSEERRAQNWERMQRTLKGLT